MPFWSKPKQPASRPEPVQSEADARNAMAGLRWLTAANNPFGVDLLDCRSLTQTVTSVTQNPEITRSYAGLRSSTGENFRGQDVESSSLVECDLRHPPAGETRDGPLFKSTEMEAKWDIYLYDGFLYFARSWTGILEYRATVQFAEQGTYITAVQASKALLDSDPFYPVAAVDFLIRSHLYRLPLPHPFPASMKGSPSDLALFSFSQYGRYALYGTFGDTTRLHLPAARKE